MIPAPAFGVLPFRALHEGDSPIIEVTQGRGFTEMNADYLGRENAMPYEAEKDLVLGTWENEETGLIVSIYKYGEGEPKLQIGPRSYKKKDGSVGTSKAGRLTVGDVVWLSEVIEEIKEQMNNLFLEE
jgi:hypothetical protein